MPSRIQDALKTWLRRRIGDGNGWKPASTAEADLKRLSEMPRFPIRAALLVFLFLGLLILIFVFWKVGNPLAKVRDARQGVRYNGHSLTSLGAVKSSSSVWVGSAGGGIKVFDSQYHYFRKDITSESSQGALLGNVIQDLSVDGTARPLAAIALSESNGAPAAVQICAFDFSPRFWPNPVVGLPVFNGIADTNASCVTATFDESRLIVGTRGLGLGIYDVPNHAWSGRLTTRDGLPSDIVNDVATFHGTQGDVLWIGTAGGLCGGKLNQAGGFAKQWVFTFETGLAGRSVKRLVLNRTHLWYVTEGGGLGRVTLTDQGTPNPDSPSVALITERSIPGITDADLGWARGGRTSRDVWFTAKGQGGGRVGRHREKPYDTTGVEMPSDLQIDAIQCAAADPASAQTYLLGSRRGAFYFATPDASLNSPVAPIVSGNAGLDGVNVLGAALSGSQAVVKHKASDGPSGLLMAPMAESGPWSWVSLVGTNRFAGLEGKADLLCAASDGQRVFFGTRGKGIGVWDRQQAEVRLEFHSSLNGPAQLRSDTSLDLAYSDGSLVQVTGDNAVDLLGGSGRVGLVPPDTAPMAAREIVTADAMGPLFVCASRNRVGLYNALNFSWTELPALSDIERLAISRDRIWVATSASNLFSTSLTGEKRDWSQVLENVIDWAAHEDQVHVLALDGSKIGLHSFSGIDGSKTSSVVPEPREASPPDWRFAAIQDQKVWLIGQTRAIEIYDLKARSWSRKTLPDEIKAPLVAARRSAQAWWLLDNAKTLHLFKFADASFITDVQPDVEQFDAAQDGAAVVPRDSAESDRLLRFDESGKPRTLVGPAFGGDLGRLTDAIVDGGDVVVAQGPWLGRYRWSNHGWKSFRAPVGEVTRFHQSGGSIWAEARGSSGSSVHSVGIDSLKPVLLDKEAIASDKVTTNSAGLLILSHTGSLLGVPADNPTSAHELLAAERMPGVWPSVPELIASITGWLAVADGKTVYFYGSSGGPAHWKKTELSEKVLRLIASPNDRQLVALTESSAYLLEPPGTASQSGPKALDAAGGRIVAVSVGDSDAAWALQVGAEKGARVRFGSGTQESKEILGAALPASGTTKTILASGGGEILRLAAGGTLGSYRVENHSWETINVPEPMDEMWQVGRTVFSWSKKAKTLFLRDNSGNWAPSKDFAAQVEAVQGFSNALVLHLSGGSIAWRNEDGASLAREARAARGFPTGFGPISDVRESSNVLFLLDPSGRLALFDWGKQHWFGFSGHAVRQVVVGSRGVYLLEERPGRKFLSGPVEFSDRGPVSQEVSGATNVADVAVAAGEVFFVSSGGSMSRVRGSYSERIWGGGDAPATRTTPILRSALRVRDELWLILDVEPARSVLMKMGTSSLVSSITTFPPGRFEGIMRTDQGEFCASLVSTNGRFPVTLPAMRPLATPRADVREILVRDGGLIGITSEGVLPLQAGSGWRPGPPEPALSSEELAALRTANKAQLESLPLVPSAHGWIDPANPGKLVAVAWTNATPPNSTRAYLLPAPGRLALAHEVASDLVTVNDLLFLATPGGVLEFGAAGPPAPVALRNETPNGPLVEVTGLEELNGLVCRTPAASWRLQDGSWVPPNPASAQDRALRLETAANAPLRNWRRIPGNPQALLRRFAADQWRRVTLGPNGFDFERIVAAEVRDGQLLLYTPAGTLTFQPGTAEPGDLLPAWVTPEGLVSGTILDVGGPRSVLVPDGNSGAAFWVRGQDAWEAATTSDATALKGYATRPFLDTKFLLWERPRPGSAAEPVTDRSGSAPVAGFFHPEFGRFDWDTCLQLGQARGEHWILTPAGLFRLGPGGFDSQSRFDISSSVEQLTFLPTSGDLPGALARGGSVEWVFTGTWKNAPQIREEDRNLLASHYHAAAAWRVLRSGAVERGLPQSPQNFTPVHLQADKRWDFETVADLAGSGEDAAVATPAGVVVLKGSSGELKELWPFPGATQVGLVEGALQIQTGEGRRELRNGQWTPTAAAPSLHPATALAANAWLQIERRFPGVAAQFRPKSGAPFQLVELSSNRFPFDEVVDVAIASSQTVASATKLGLVSRFADGDIALENFPVSSFSDGRFFCRVPVSETSSSLYARSANGSVLISQNGWRPAASPTADEALSLSRRELAVGNRWHVSASAPGQVDFELRFSDDPLEVAHKVLLAPDNSGFALDRFTSVAEQSGKVMLGSRGGLERLDGSGAVERLWGDSAAGKARDGIPTGAVERTVSDADGAVHIAAAGIYYFLSRTNEVVHPSSAGTFNQALAQRHSDPDGWRVRVQPAGPTSLSIWWKGEPVFLVDQKSGHARFGHNIINAALQTSEGLWLATEGGLLVLPTASVSGIERCKLVVSPFQSADALDNGRPPASVTWLGHTAKGGQLLLRTGGSGTALWQANPAAPAGVTRATALDASLIAPRAADDLLVWKQPDSLRLEVAFAPGWVFPDSVPPQIKEGTFSFLNLDVPGQSPDETIVSTTNRFVWATRAGTLILTRGAVNKWRLDTQSESQSSMADVNSLSVDTESCTVFAALGGSSFRLDSSSDNWSPSPTQPELVALRTPRMVWTGRGPQSRPQLLRTDAPTVPVLQDGRPAVDQVADIALTLGDPEPAVVVASSGGVVSYKANSFEHIDVQANAFLAPSGELTKVSEVACAPVGIGSNPRLCAKAGWRSYERTGGKWAEQAMVEDVFEMGYRRVTQTNQWNWSRYPSGLSVELLNVNGPAVFLGQAIDESRLPLFSRGRVSLDDIRCLALGDKQLLLGSTVGIVRFDLNRDAMHTRYAGIDLWALHETEPGRLRSLTNITGIAIAGRLLTWNSGHAFNNSPSDRRWLQLGVRPAALLSSRFLTAGRQKWLVEKRTPNEVAVAFADGGSGSRYYVPVAPSISEFRYAYDSADGLFLLAGNNVFHLNRSRAELARRFWGDVFNERVSVASFPSPTSFSRAPAEQQKEVHADKGEFTQLAQEHALKVDKARAEERERLAIQKAEAEAEAKARAQEAIARAKTEEKRKAGEAEVARLAEEDKLAAEKARSEERKRILESNERAKPTSSASASSQDDKQRAVSDNTESLGAYQLIEMARQAVGRGDFERAVSAYKQLVSKQPTNADAYYELGSALYQIGKYAEASESYDRSSKLRKGVQLQGSDFANAAMGNNVRNPTNTRTLPEIRAAAENGDRDAQYALGIEYEKGEAVEKDVVEAYAWLHRAAEAGQRQALMARYELSRSMTQSQIKEGIRRGSQPLVKPQPSASHDGQPAKEELKQVEDKPTAAATGKSPSSDSKAAGQTEVADLRLQANKLKEELSIARRLESIRKGLYSSAGQSGAQVLSQGMTSAGGKVTKPAYDLNVEVAADGSVRVVPSLTNERVIPSAASRKEIALAQSQLPPSQPLPDASSAGFQIEGTVWRYTRMDNPNFSDTLHFESYGLFWHAPASGGGTKETGKWKLTGNQLSFQAGDVHWQGEISSDRIKGTAAIDGLSGSWSWIAVTEGQGVNAVDVPQRSQPGSEIQRSGEKTGLQGR